MDTRVNIDLDTKYSWVVAVGSCFVNFCIYGLWRSYGILYVGFMERYKINHQNASTPFLYACAIYHLIGPIVGILSYKFTLRSLQMIGVLLASFGVAMVKLSTNFTLVIIGVGIIQGIGLGIIRTLSNVVIQQFFYKHRAIATAISMSGGVFSSFIFPSLGSYLLANYEIETSFLIFGGIIFAASIGVAVQREPRYECNSIKINDQFFTVEKLKSREASLVKCFKCSLLNNELKGELKCEACKNDSVGSQYGANGESPALKKENCLNGLDCKPEDKVLSLAKAESSTETTAGQPTEEKKKGQLDRQGDSAMSSLLFISKRAMFYLISLTFVVYNICLQVFLMTIVDMTKKFEITRDDVGIRLISLFSLADLIGRLSSGWFLDKNYTSFKNVTIICEALLFASFMILPNLDTLLGIQLVTFVIGLMIGIITILWPLLNVSYFGTQCLPILLGLNCFFSGLESLFRPFLIGFYLDGLNSYKYLYYNIAVFAGLVTLLWALEPLLNKKKK